MIALLVFWGPLAYADDTNAPAATTNAPAAAANNDPGGGATGTIGDSSGAAGAYTYNGQVTAPSDLSDEDKKDPAKVAKYKDDKKAFDDYAAQAKAEPFAAKLADAVGHNRVSINFVWTLVTGFLVMFMQAGFALVETGLTRAKNAAHTMTMNMLIYPLGMLGFWVCGFAFMFGGVGTPGAGTLGACSSLNHEWTWHLFGKDFGIIGLKGFFLSWDAYDVGVFCLFLFQMVFMDTTATIPTGACAERWKFSAFCLYGCFIGSVMYPVFGNWVWGGGWLSQLGVNFGLGHGHVDFAGSSVVHMQGGVIGLIFAWLLGPRIGKFNKDGTVNPMPPHSIPMAILGTFILAFGWFGFNPGSTLAGTDLRIAVVATNTMLASATGCMGAVLWMWWVRTKKPDPSMACNGMLAGLVAITCPCAFVTSFGACMLGLVAGILVCESVFFFDRLKIDDPVGAISVHGTCGAWGCLSLGLFGDGKYGQGWNNAHWFMLPDGTYKMMDPLAAPKGSTEMGVLGLFYGGGFSQLIAEFVGVLTCFITLSVLSLVVFKVVNLILGTHRVVREVELDGLDIPEMGITGYSGIVMDKQAETPLPKGETSTPSPPPQHSLVRS
jgi:Amt family ammonium transporter